MERGVNMRWVRNAVACTFIFGLSLTQAQAALITFNINADGAQEVTSGGTPNQGDPNGFAIGTITLDNVANSALINLSIGNIDGALTGHHIHQAPSTTTGAIVLNFGNPNTMLTGTSGSGTLVGTISFLSNSVINSIFANPGAFYYNLHSVNFPAGAVRDQLALPVTPVPEPASGALALIGLAMLAAVRSHKKR